MAELRGLAEAELLEVVDALQEGLQVIDREYRFVYLNQAAVAHSRARPAELLGRTMSECYPGIESTPMFTVLRRCMEEGVPASLDNEFRYPDGKVRNFELRMRRCAAGAVILSIDVTERRGLEGQLRQAQKMEAVSQLAGSVAHDFNNLLSVILSYTAMMLEEQPPDSPMIADLEAIRQAGQRGAELTRQLLTLSRNQPETLRPIDLNAQLAQSEPLWRRLLLDIRVVLHLAPAPVRVLGDPGKLEQIVLNLLVNARDAMPGGGVVTIETDTVELDAEYASRHVGVVAGRYGLLAVSDSGTGMDAETQARIFEPFFTTKPVGKGTGLGLATVFGIVKQANGHVWVYSELGKGSAFRIYLPSADHVTASLAPEQEPRDGGGSEVILLVEDEPLVRTLAAGILQRAGYTVLVADDAAHAQALSAANPEGVDLLITDVILPDGSGPDVVDRIAGEQP
ncbi:MAG: PAS domain-containing protein, partial [Deltaproteobacteria bacterium]|nr:PAS domain-containing protein [Deltaproteobacteria bacterium]